MTDLRINRIKTIKYAGEIATGDAEFSRYEKMTFQQLYEMT